jgi:hypothetical protein
MVDAMTVLAPCLGASRRGDRRKWMSSGTASGSSRVKAPSSSTRRCRRPISSPACMRRRAHKVRIGGLQALGGSHGTTFLCEGHAAPLAERVLVAPWLDRYIDLP